MFARIFSVMLLGVVLVPSLGTFPAFLYRQSEIRSDIKHSLKNGVPEGELHHIAFRKVEDIHWTRPDKEFTLHGRLYDVVKNLSKDGKVAFLCINDLEEEALFANLDDLVSHRHKKHSGNYQWSSFLLAQSLIPALEEFIFSQHLIDQSITKPSHYYAQNLSLGYPDELFAPPRPQC